jgi:hypothetical protein
MVDAAEVQQVVSPEMRTDTVSQRLNLKNSHHDMIAVPLSPKTLPLGEALVLSMFERILGPHGNVNGCNDAQRLSSSVPRTTAAATRPPLPNPSQLRLRRSEGRLLLHV